MWANPASLLEQALPHSSPFHLPLFLPGFCSRPHLAEPANASASLPRCCEVCGALRLSHRDLSFPGAVGQEPARPRASPRSRGLQRVRRDRAGTADLPTGAARPGPGWWGETPGVSISGCESGEGANLGQDGSAQRIGSTSTNQHFFPPPSFHFSSSPAPAVPLSALLISLCAPLTRTLLSKQVQLPLNRL